MSNPNTRKSCVVPKCKSTTTNAPEKLFFVVPKDVQQRKKWMKCIKRLDPVGAKSIVYCCEDHFDIENDMENYIKFKLVGGRIKLKEGTVPHKFKCQQENNDKPERSAVEKRNRIKCYKKLFGQNEESIPSILDAPENPQEVFVACCEDETVVEDPLSIGNSDQPLEISIKHKAVQVKLNNKVVYKSTTTIKHEIGELSTQVDIVDPIKNHPPPHFDPASVCCCCLSPSRSLGPLSRSPPWTGAPSVCARVCWECAATLARACRFRERVNAAEAALRRASETQITTEIKSLSTLTSSTKDTYDYVFEFDYRLNSQVKSENTMDVFLPHTIGDQEIIIDDIKNEPEYSEVKTEMIELFGPDQNDLSSDNNDNIDAASDNNDATSDNNDAVTYVNDATTNNDEPHARVKVTKPNLGRECGICHETINYHMTQHYLNCHHPDDQPRCRLCDKELACQTSYVRHMQNVHMPKKYKCTFCNKLFSKPVNKQLHIDRMHVRALKHKCTECGKAVSSAILLNEHMRRVHKNRKLCKYCEKTFESLTQLTEHLHTHTGERPYKCAHCHKAFAQKCNVMSHIKCMHKDVI